MQLRSRHPSNLGIFIGIIIIAGSAVYIWASDTVPTGLARTIVGSNHFQNFSTLALATKPITDKIDGHHYGEIYDVYFTEEIYQKDVKFLEIGLGCDMAYGPGASAQIWPKLFPKGEIWFAEYDKKCVDNYWNSSLPWKAVTGNQGDRETVKRWTTEFMSATGGGTTRQFDFIIDDGGHTNAQIWNSFTYLFDVALKPGGVYFIEDMHVGRKAQYYSGGIQGKHRNGPMADVITDWVDQLLMSWTDPATFVVEKRYNYKLSGITRVDCIREMCAITKAF